jgi:hypothetical protein
MRAITRFFNHRVFKITGSHNFEHERPGALNRFTPAVFKLKYALIHFKKTRFRIYSGAKYAMYGLLVYAIFLREIFSDLT